jgi:integrase
MSVYFVKGKGWGYDFTHKGTRQTEAWFETKKAATKAEAARREELNNPAPTLPASQQTPTGMTFLELVNLRLDHVQGYNSESHYRDIRYHCRRWVKEWGKFACDEINPRMIEAYLKGRKKVSAHVANKELQYLRALFNFGIKKEHTGYNPTRGIGLYPIEKRVKYIPPKEDVFKVISCADPEAQQYLWTIVLTAARVSEINVLTWDDIDLQRRLVTLWTRKRKGGNREPRQVPMVPQLFDILTARHRIKDPSMPWVFWHSYWSRKKQESVKGPFIERKLLMTTLCAKAQVRYFRYHALRHLTASILDDLGVPIGVIQRILGHQNRRTTEIYLHTIGEAERDAMAKLANIDLFQSQVTPVTDHNNVNPAFWKRRAVRPSLEALQEDIEQLGYSGTGRKYGVSDNAIRKWIAAFEKESGMHCRGT